MKKGIYGAWFLSLFFVGAEALANREPASISEEENAPKESTEEADPELLESYTQSLRGPKAVPDEHILVAQRKTIFKEGAHELSPFFVGIQPADSFRKQLVWGLSYTYHFNGSLALEALHLSFLKNINSNLETQIRTVSGLGVDRIEPVLSVGSTLQWTPLRAKAAGRRVVNYFEGYFLGGGGYTKFSSDGGALLMVGVGFRSYLYRGSILKIELRNYSDFRSGSSVTYRPTLLVGASVLWGGT